MPLRLRTSDASHRVTTFELFFDLVYVYAFTQVSHLMAEAHSALGVLQALIVLGLLWWTWTSFSWLANQSPADQGVLRAGMSVAMATIFVATLAIPESFHDLPGGLDGPVVFVVAYGIVRMVHMSLYLVAGRDDRACSGRCSARSSSRCCRRSSCCWSARSSGSPPRRGSGSARWPGTSRSRS